MVSTLPAWLSARRVSTSATLAALAIAGLAQPFGDRPVARHAAAVVPAAVPPAVEPVRLAPVPPSSARAINAAVAVARDAGPVAQSFRPASVADHAVRARDCLAVAMFFEAGDKPDDQRAVAQVVLNRVRHPAFPKTVCEVVFQGSERRTGCQFTFTCDGAMRRYTPSAAAWARARAVAAEAIAGAVYAPVGLATHYHADWVVPYWSAKLDKIAQVGPHIFYRWNGWWGKPRAFRSRDAGVERRVTLMAGLSEVHRGDTDERPGDGVAVARGPVRPMLSTASDPDLFLIGLRAGAGAEYEAHARALCAERSSCVVMGWTDRRKVARSLPLTLEQMDALAFRYVRTGRGAAIARWDCARAPRRDRAECLRPGRLLAPPPGGDAALAAAAADVAETG